MDKAIKKDTLYGKYSNTVSYEYRGHTYDVEYSTCHSYLCTPAWVQHRDNQDRIDKEIERQAQDQNTHPFDLDEIWSIMGWD